MWKHDCLVQAGCEQPRTTAGAAVASALLPAVCAYASVVRVTYRLGDRKSKTRNVIWKHDKHLHGREHVGLIPMCVLEPHIVIFVVETHARMLNALAYSCLLTAGYSGLVLRST